MEISLCMTCYKITNVQTFIFKNISLRVLYQENCLNLSYFYKGVQIFPSKVLGRF